MGIYRNKRAKVCSSKLEEIYFLFNVDSVQLRTRIGVQNQSARMLEPWEPCYGITCRLNLAIMRPSFNSKETLTYFYLTLFKRQQIAEKFRSKLRVSLFYGKANKDIIESYFT